MRMAHEDEFLQMIETTAVKSNMEVLRCEQLMSRDKAEGGDALADTSLYDLRLLHNGAQRSKQRPQSAGSRSRPVSASSRAASGGRQPLDSTATEQVTLRQLCNEMTADLRKNCTRLGTSNVSTEAMQTVRTREDLWALEELRAYTMTFEDEHTKKKRLQKELIKGFAKGRFTQVAMACRPDDFTDTAVTQDEVVLPPQEPEKEEEPVVAPPAPKLFQPQRVTARRLAELIGFILTCCPSIESLFKSFDSEGDNDLTLSCKEWVEGMQRLGFPDDVSYVFRLLGKGTDGSATLDEVEGLFEPFLKRSR